jgi:predicted permease
MDWKQRIREELTSGDRLDDEVVEELAQHARAVYDAARADGGSGDDAAARVAAVIDRWRLERPLLRRRPRRPAMVDPPAAGGSLLGGVMQDLRYAARLLRHQPRLTLLVVVTMALGIGGATVLFSVSWRVLMKPMPWPNAPQLIALREARGGNPPRFGEFTNAAYLAWLEEAKTIDGLAAWTGGGSVTLEAGGPPERVRTARATATLFPLLGVQPLAGSFFSEADARAPVVVIGEGLWRRRFAADPAAIGKTILMDGRPHTIIGVLAEAAAYPDAQTEAWRPFAVTPARGNFLSLFSAVAKLKPGFTLEQAAAEGTARGRFALDTSMTTTALFGNTGPIEITAQSLRDAMTGGVRQPLLILLTAVGLLLATATANVASLQLARATTRRRELAIRAALGAGRARVTRQLMIENLLLGVLGGAAGLALAWLLHGSLPAVLPPDFPRRDTLAIDGVVVLFAAAITIAAALMFGLAPIAGLRRMNLASSLVDDGTKSVGASAATARGRATIMTAQVAIACVLLVGASLLGRSFVALVAFDRGFDPAQAVAAFVSLPNTLYTPERRLEIVHQLLDRLSRHPAVAHAGFTSEMPLTRGGSTTAFRLRSPLRGGEIVDAQFSPRIVSPGYFAAIGMRVVQGRGFTETDTDATPTVVVVNRAFARQYLGETPLGLELPIAGYNVPDGQRAHSTVIGVVDDVRYLAPHAVSQPEIFYAYRQMRGQLRVQALNVVVRTTGDPAALVPAMRTAVREGDANLVPEGVATLEDRVARTVARPRLYALLLSGFAVGAVAIAGVGLFGVLSYVVAQRSRELAVRSALGASRSQVVRLVVRQGLLLTLAGVAVGLGASLLLMRTIATQLFGVSPFDPVTYALAPAILLAVAAIACAAPALAASKVDPVRVLRNT